MESTDMDQQLWFAGRWWWFPGSRIDAESEFEYSSGGTAGLTCWNPMAAPSRASCSWARSCLIKAAILTDRARFPR
jgi:hypothetical protein